MASGSIQRPLFKARRGQSLDQTSCRWMLTRKGVRPLVARHGLVQYNPTPHLKLHPHPTPSLATLAAISTTGQTAQTIVRLHHITE